MMLEVIVIGKNKFVELPCACGCGKTILTKLRKYFSLKCYGKSLEKKVR